MVGVASAESAQDFSPPVAPGVPELGPRPAERRAPVRREGFFVEFCPNCNYWLAGFTGLYEAEWMELVHRATLNLQGTESSVRLARRMVRQPSTPEVAAWETGLDALGFVPSVPMASYVLDFYSAHRRLAVEIDGPRHWIDDETVESDPKKDEIARKVNREDLDGILRVPAWMVGPPFWETVKAAIDNRALWVPLREGSWVPCVAGHVLTGEECNCYRPYTHKSSWDRYLRVDIRGLEG